MEEERMATRGGLPRHHLRSRTTCPFQPGSTAAPFLAFRRRSSPATRKARLVPTRRKIRFLLDVVEEDDQLYESDDTDSDFEDNDWRFWDGGGGGDAAGLVAAGTAEFLRRPARFASFQNTAGFMRLAAAEARTPAPAHAHDDGRGEIVVHYRYTRFSRPRRRGRSAEDDDGVEVRNWATKTYDVRFLVPFPVAGAGDAASSLRLAGAAVASDFYPKRSYVQLQALWASMVAAAPVRGVPPRATRVVVTVDAGILRRDDATPGRMARMLAEVETLARESDALDMTCGTVMHLPAPVMQIMRRDESSSEVVSSRPPPKKRRFAAVASSEEECAICCEVMEKGLAAWPRCSHVFHGRCLEELLVRGAHRCPMCRRKLWT